MKKEDRTNLIKKSGMSVFETMTLIIAFLLLTCIYPAFLYSRDARKEELAADSINQFAFDIYRRLGNKKENVICSPVSLSAALALAYGGAAGKTGEEFDQIFFSEKNVKNPHRHLGKLLKSLETKTNSEMFSLVYSIWIERTFEIKGEYISMMKDAYGAEPKQIDFIREPEKSRLAINVWAEENTMKKIRDLITPGMISSDTCAVLVNAAYFKGSWLFPAGGYGNETRPEPFWVTRSAMKKVPTMHMEGHFFTSRGEGYKAVFLDYSGKDINRFEEGENTMIIVVPDKKDGLSGIERSITAASFMKMIKRQRTRPAREREFLGVALPKFKLDATHILNEHLQKAGLLHAFSDDADFSAMTKKKIKISRVIQKTFIDVNEKGTEAAAATAIMMEGATGMRDIPPTFAVNRPFMYFLCNKKSGVILFMGRVVNPAYW